MILFKRLFKRRSSFATLQRGDGTILLPGFCIYSTQKNISEVRVTIGKNSVIGGRISLDRGTGRVIIGDNTYIGDGNNLICINGIEIGSDVMMAWGCTIADHDSHSVVWSERANDVNLWRQGLNRGGVAEALRIKNWAIVKNAPIKICDKVWLGFNVIILKGVTVGEGAVVAAGSIVTHDVEPWTLVAGNPARSVKSLKQEKL